MEVLDWALVGYRDEDGQLNVGGELARQVAKLHVSERLAISQFPLYVVRSAGILAPDGPGLHKLVNTGFTSIRDIDDWPHVTMLAPPSTDTGNPEAEYLMDIFELDERNIAVTCAKGGLANYFEKLRRASDGFRRLGYNGSVGGGTRMLEAMEIYCRDLENITQIHLVLNGSLNAILSAVSAGSSLGQAVEAARVSKFVEPGNDDPYEIIRAEACGDIPKKIVIMLKALGFANGEAKPLDWRDFQFELTRSDISRVIEEVRHRRFIVSVYPQSYADVHGKYEEDDIIGKFSHEFGTWRVVGGFRDTNRNTNFLHLATMPGPSNSFVIGLGPHEEDGLIQGPIGPGAGQKPTVNTMLDDLAKLRRL